MQGKKKYKQLKIPFFASAIPAGFPSPADDIVDATLDLNTHIVKNPSSTFYLRVKGDSMNLAGIFEDDILVVDKSLEHKNNCIVIAVINGEFTVKRLFLSPTLGWILKPESSNPSHKPMVIKGDDFELQIWGIVTHVISSKYW